MCRFLFAAPTIESAASLRAQDEDIDILFSSTACSSATPVVCSSQPLRACCSGPPASIPQRACDAARAQNLALAPRAPRPLSQSASGPVQSSRRPAAPPRPLHHPDTNLALDRSTTRPARPPIYFSPLHARQPVGPIAASTCCWSAPPTRRVAMVKVSSLCAPTHDGGVVCGPCARADTSLSSGDPSRAATARRTSSRNTFPFLQKMP